MPKIDIYTADTRQAAPNQPLQFQEAGDTRILQLSQEANKIATQWVGIRGRMLAQESDLTFLQSKADYEAGVANALIDTERDPEVIENPKLFEQKYGERVDKLTKDVSTSIKDPRARSQFEAYRGVQAPMEYVKARATGLRMWDNKLKEEFYNEKDRLSTQASMAPTTEEFEANVDLFQRLVTNTVINKGFTPAQGEKELVEFRKTTAEKNMKYIGSQDPERMRRLNNEGFWSKSVDAAKRSAILEHVATQEHEQLQRQREQFNIASKAYMDTVEARAVYGRATQEEIQRGLSGKDPLQPDPKAWVALQKLNEEAPGLNANDATGLRAIDAIRLLYGLIKEPTKQDAQSALMELDKLREQGLSHKAMLHAISATEHIQGRIVALDAATKAAERQEEADVRRAKTEARQAVIDERTARRDQEAQLDRKVNLALEEFDAQYKRTFLGGTVGKMDENKRLLMRYQLKELMHKHPELDSKSAIERILGTKEAPQTRQPSTVDKLLRPR